MTKKNTNNDDLLALIIKGIEDVKGNDINILDLREIENTVCDYFVICNGNSNTQVNAIVCSVQKDVSKTEKEIFNLLNNDAQLRSKRELIEKFIKENLPVLQDTDDIPEAFDKFWNEEQQKAITQLVKDENLSADKTEKLIEDYLFAEREPLRDEVLELIEGNKPTILERKKVGDRILAKILDFVDTFINGIA